MLIFNGCCHSWAVEQSVKYSQVPLQHDLIYYDITYDTAKTVAESESDIRITTDTPFLALMGQLWGV